MRALTQHLSALIVTGLCAAALLAAGWSVSGLAGWAQRMLGDNPAAGAPLALAASAAARLDWLRPDVSDDQARLR